MLYYLAHAILAGVKKKAVVRYPIAYRLVSIDHLEITHQCSSILVVPQDISAANAAGKQAGWIEVLLTT